MRFRIPITVLIASALLAAAVSLAQQAGDAGPRLRPATLVRRTQQVARSIAEAREFAVHDPVRSSVVGRGDLIDLMRRRMQEETPSEDIRRESALLKRLGFIAEDVDYEALLYDMLEDQIAGVYDTDDRTLYVLDDLYMSEAVLTLWHEVVHALQDQNFRVGDRQDEMEDDGDRLLAYRAVCEGDAVITSTLLQGGFGASALDYFLPSDAASLRAMYVVPEVDGELPAALLEVMLFPYVEGVLFVKNRLAGGTLESISDLFRLPPVSTEQILHPEKYERGEAPVAIRFGALPPDLDGWEIAYDDTFGEIGVRLWLAGFGPREAAVMASAGWGGDRVALVERLPPEDEEAAVPEPDPTGRDAWVIWHTAWDSAAAGHGRGSSGEAIEFERAVIRGLGSRLCEAGDAIEGELEPRDVDPPEPWTLDAGSEGSAAVFRVGRRVLVALGPAGEHAAAARIVRWIAERPESWEAAGESAGADDAESADDDD